VTHRDGRAVVIKRYDTAQVDTVFAAMQSLWASPFGESRTPPGMPEPLALEGTEVTMAMVTGETLGVRGDAERSHRQLPGVARLITDFQFSGVEVARRGSSDKLLRSLARNRGRLAPGLAEPFDRALGALGAVAPEDEPLVLGHGDMSPRNILIDGDTLTLIDFDSLQMSGRGRDLAYLGAWTWVTDWISHGSATWQLADDLGAAADDCAGLPHNTWWITAPFYRAAGLLRIAQRWSSLATRPDQARRVIDEAHRLAAERPKIPRQH
jgi:Phosphotransferase enzyme family